MSNLNTPILATLQSIIDKLKGCKDLNLKNVTFVCVQHLLFTTIDLIKSLIKLGAKPNNIHIMGKIYSNCPIVIAQLIEMGVNYYPSSQPQQFGYFNYYFNIDIANMWANVATTIMNVKSDTIIILDDGSKCTTNIPKLLSDNYKVFAVEQTSSGVVNITKKNNTTLPFIDVAYSATKQILEPPMIAQAVIQKLDKILPLQSHSLICGVVGLGAIGRAVARKLLSLNHKVIIYDKSDSKYNLMKKIKTANNILSLFQKSEYIFGCTGEDITLSLDVNKIRGTKNLISCSSQDIEFQSLLHIIQDNSSINTSNVLDNIEYSTDSATFNIFRGGYPVNLDNYGESVPANDIQLTRGLLLGGIVQAVFHLVQEVNQKPQQYMLHPKIQKLIVKELVYNQKYKFSNDLVVMNFLDEEWIKNNSSGEYVSNDIISRYFL
ncbi:NAD(P)-dependent oxidoreductase [Candidatus Tisiphia endosymbiont of Oplodontha viridula]|uniref:NAD(P)-dependent oxidoreductase n=1 Tax=Candidatus Tisiphia endosymbiont of Oplodontha viridula TaxID=3077925 RepID=UPI0035C91F0D